MLSNTVVVHNTAPTPTTSTGATNVQGETGVTVNDKIDGGVTTATEINTHSGGGGAAFDFAIEYRAPNVLAIPVLGAVGVGKATWIASAIRLLETESNDNEHQRAATTTAAAVLTRRRIGRTGTCAMIPSGHRSGFTCLNFYAIHVAQAALMRHLADCKRFVIVFDVTCRASLVDNLDAFLTQIRHFNPPAGENDVPKIIILVANKMDKGRVVGMGANIKENTTTTDEGYDTAAATGSPPSGDGGDVDGRHHPSVNDRGVPLGDHDARGDRDTEMTRLFCLEARRIAEEGGFMYAETVGSTGEGVMEALLMLLHKLPHTPFMTALHGDPSLLHSDIDNLSME